MHFSNTFEAKSYYTLTYRRKITYNQLQSSSLRAGSSLCTRVSHASYHTVCWYHPSVDWACINVYDVIT